MLDTLDERVLPQHLTKDREFRAAQALAGRGCCADRAMILRQKIGAISSRAPLGPIAFGAPRSSQGCPLRRQTLAPGEDLPIVPALIALVYRYQPLQPCVPENGPRRLDECQCQIGVS